MRFSSALFIVALLWCVGCTSPEEQEAAPVPFFGQEPPGGVAELFAPGIVSVEGRYEYALSVSPEGDEILFSAEAPEVPAAIFHSRLEDGGWTVPEKVSLAGGAKRAEMEAFFTPDGKRIYFAPYDEGMDVRIWAIERSPEGLSSPREMASPMADDPAFFPTATASGAVYYTNLAARKIFRATVEGDDVTIVEDAGLEFGMHAFVSPDESYVLVDGRPEGKEESDIFVAFRNEDGNWARPIVLGPEVNSEFGETCPALSHDGRFLFFSRYNEENEISNIYWIDSEVIERARAMR
jgi:Tol biopolymer transport system component